MEPFYVTAINTADRIAPAPNDEADATREAWLRHYVAQGLAANAAFEMVVSAGQVGPEHGLLIGMAVAATAAAVALDNPDEVGPRLWQLTPEAGALNGEWVEWLTERADQLGINPADVDPRLSAADFASPSRAVAV